MRSNRDYARALKLADSGLNDVRVARELGLPRTTVRDWRRTPRNAHRLEGAAACPQCGHPEHDYERLARSHYAYLLGMYLGDGVIDRLARTWRMRIALDAKWSGIARDCVASIQAVLPDNAVSSCRPDPRVGCVVVSVYSKQLTCLFPQHGLGPKHLRRIELSRWQLEIVVERAQEFVRGLIHSDGCRFVNRVRVAGRDYAYPRYNFTNASDDIRTLFTSACDRLGIEWTQMNARNISVAKRDSVARLDEFVGPKR
jgi:hypothetical protein